MKKKFFVGLLALLCMTCMVGCKPPVSVTFRGSLMDWGNKVMQITNRSGSETLVLNVHVKNKEKRQQRSHIVKVTPGETVELGILEMGWTFEKGETFSISADGYLLDYTGTVP